MDESTKKLVACSLVNAYYAGQEVRPGFAGTDRRKGKPLPEGVRDLRSPTITPGEVFDIYQGFLKMIEKS